MEKPKSVVVLYNQVGEDWYEKLQQVDPSTLPFEPEYPVHVPTAKEEYEEVARALRRAGYRARAVNLENDLRRLERVLKRNRPDVIFNLVEFFHDDAALESAVTLIELNGIPIPICDDLALDVTGIRYEILNIYSFISKCGSGFCSGFFEIASKRMSETDYATSVTPG